MSLAYVLAVYQGLHDGGVVFFAACNDAFNNHLSVLLISISPEGELISFYEKKKRSQRKVRPTSAENSSTITEINGRSDAPSLAQLTFPRRPVAPLDNLSNCSGGPLKGIVQLRS